MKVVRTFTPSFRNGEGPVWERDYSEESFSKEWESILASNPSWLQNLKQSVAEQLRIGESYVK